MSHRFGELGATGAIRLSVDHGWARRNDTRPAGGIVAVSDVGFGPDIIAPAGGIGISASAASHAGTPQLFSGSTKTRLQPTSVLAMAKNRLRIMSVLHASKTGVDSWHGCRS